MPIYRVEGVKTSNGLPAVVIVRADSEADARNGVIRHGVRSQTIMVLRAGDVPTDMEILDVRPSMVEDRTQDLVRRLAHSNLINHPIKTIACGTFLGILAFYLLLLLFAVTFGADINIG